MKRGKVKHQLISQSLAYLKDSKTNCLKQPLLSSLAVKKFLLTLGFEAKFIILISKNDQFLWLVRGSYQRKNYTLSLDFYACIIQGHKKSPAWPLACPHSSISLDHKSYHINEVGPQIFLEEDKS